ncbi:MAG: hypothetical protein CME36_18020 [unclassified Hahellaceae]|nr:hypothetical protein [Hahellaceae bacterium]
MSIETGFKGLQLQAKALSQSAEKGWQTGGMALPFSLGENAAGSKGSSFAAMLQSSRQPERVPATPSAPARPAPREDRPASSNTAQRQDASRRADPEAGRERTGTRPTEANASKRAEENDRTGKSADSVDNDAEVSENAVGSLETDSSGPFSKELNALVDNLPADELVTAFEGLSALADDADGLTLDELKGWLEENSELLQQTVDLFSHVPTEDLQAMLDDAGVAPESQSMLQAILAFSELESTPALEAAGVTEADLADLLGFEGDLAAGIKDVSAGIQQLATHIAVVADDNTVAMDEASAFPAGLMDATDDKASFTNGTPAAETSEDGGITAEGQPLAAGAATKPTEGVATNERLMFAQMLANREGAAADESVNIRQTAGQLTPLAAAVAGPAQSSVATDQAGKPLLPFQTSLQASINDGIEWKEQFEQKLSWFLKEGIRSARLQLNPTDMGPIDVRIQVQKDQAQIHVFAQNQQVREMLEGTSHKLRDMLASQNIDLSGFDVSSQGRDGQTGQRSGEQGTGGYGGNAGSTAAELEVEAAEVLVGSQNIRLVDQYV